MLASVKRFIDNELDRSRRYNSPQGDQEKAKDFGAFLRKLSAQRAYGGPIKFGNFGGRGPIAPGPPHF